MSRISIDVTPDEHKKLKALAALRGKSIKDFVLECTLGSTGAATQAMNELEALLDERIRKAEKELREDRSVKDIFDEATQDPADQDRIG